MIQPIPFPMGLREEATAAPEVWVEAEGSPRLRARLATAAFVALSLILFMAWLIWDQNRLIASQLDEIRRLQQYVGQVEELQQYVRQLEERLGIVNQIRSHRPGLPREEATAIAHAVQMEARRYDLDWRLLLAIIRVESGFNPRARSPRGAVGLMQVMPAAYADVAGELGWTNTDQEELEDFRVNLRVGAHYFFTLVRRFGDMEKAVQAYYLGPSRITEPSDEWARRGRQYLEAVRLSRSSS